MFVAKIKLQLLSIYFTIFQNKLGLTSFSEQSYCMLSSIEDFPGGLGWFIIIIISSKSSTNNYMVVIIRLAAPISN